MSFIPPTLRDAWGQLNIWSAPQAAVGYLDQESTSSLEDRAILAGELPGLLDQARSVALIVRADGVPEPIDVRGIEHAIEVDGVVSVAYSKTATVLDAGEAIEVRIRWGDTRVVA